MLLNMSRVAWYAPPVFIQNTRTDQERNIWNSFDPFTTCKIEDGLQDITKAIKNANNYSGETAGAHIKDGTLLCPDIAEDVFRNLRLEEVKIRPNVNYIETVQKNMISPTTRAICVEMLDFAFEQFRYATITLHLAVNYLDRYLSVNAVDETSLGLVSLACLMVASKYEEVRSSNGVDFKDYIFLTNGVYSREDFIQMEQTILKCLSYNLTRPTIPSFLEWFLIGAGQDEAGSLESMASYISELSLASYDMLHFLPSMVAASSVFLAHLIILPLERPWNATLQHYTQYKLSDLRDCVFELHAILWDESGCFDLPDIRLKYCQQRFHFVAERRIPSSIPSEVFEN